MRFAKSIEPEYLITTGPSCELESTTLAPKYDFGIFEVKDYAKILMGIFAGVLELSMERLPGSSV